MTRDREIELINCDFKEARNGNVKCDMNMNNAESNRKPNGLILLLPMTATIYTHSRHHIYACT